MSAQPKTLIRRSLGGANVERTSHNKAEQNHNSSNLEGSCVKSEKPFLGVKFFLLISLIFVFGFIFFGM
jgi:hypothetical protein